MMCDGCAFLSFSLKIDSSLRVYHMMKKLNLHSDVNKQLEPVKHIRKHPNHKFTWEVLTTAYSWLKRRIKEAFYMAHFRPELKKQSAITGPHLVPIGIT